MIENLQEKSNAELKDMIISANSFGQRYYYENKDEILDLIAEKTTQENILIYDRTGATPTEIAKDFEPIITRELDAILSHRFQVVNRPVNETNTNIMKFAVSCAIKDDLDRILWLRRFTPDLYGKTITGVSGHVAYDDIIGWNSKPHTVNDLIKVIENNMFKEFCEELGVYVSDISLFDHKANVWKINGIDNYTFNCIFDSCKHPAYYTDSYKLVCNTDMYGNNPYISFMYQVRIPDSTTFPLLKSGEPHKHTLEYGTISELLEQKNDCTTLLPQLLKSFKY